MPTVLEEEALLQRGGVQAGHLVMGGYGSKINHQELGAAGFSPCFHLSGFHFGYILLTHSHLEPKQQVPAPSKDSFLLQVQIPSGRASCFLVLRGGGGWTGWVGFEFQPSVSAFLGFASESGEVRLHWNHSVAQN